MNRLTICAPAKINLGLDVLRRRPDGYHEVKMVMQTVGLYDELTFQRGGSGIRLFTDREELPGDESNLVYRAAKLLTETYGLREGIEIRLSKRIPMAAGMAGGSTDAAAVFRAFNECYGLTMSAQRMRKLAVKIGADVPYCLEGGTALAEGIGEVLTPLPSPPDCFLVIAKPDISVSTRYVYENLDVGGLTSHPDIDGLIRGLRAGDLQCLASHMENVLETVTQKRYPVIGEIKKALMHQGALAALMSGSGPTVFALFESEEKAQAAERALRKRELVKQLFVTTFVDKGETEYGEA